MGLERRLQAAALGTHTCRDLVLVDGRRAWELGVPRSVGPARQEASQGSSQQGPRKVMLRQVAGEMQPLQGWRPDPEGPKGPKDLHERA